jgi:hypothetical protein
VERCDCGTFRNDVGQCPNCGRGYCEVDPVKKVRRRIEDYLRKADSETIVRIAKENNINIT